MVSEDLAYFQEESPWSIRRGKKSNIINHNWWHLPAAQQINKNLPSDPDDKSQFGLSWDVVVACLASHPAHADFTPVHLPVFFVVSFSSLEDEFPGDFAGLWTWEEMHAQFWLYADALQIYFDLSLDTTRQAGKVWTTNLLVSCCLLLTDSLDDSKPLSPLQEAFRDWGNLLLSDEKPKSCTFVIFLVSTLGLQTRL